MCGTQLEGVDGFKSFNIFQIDDMPLNNIDLVEHVEILGTIYAINSLVVVSDVNYVVRSPLAFLVILVESGKRICNNFEDFFIPFYKSPFTWINIRLQLYEF